MGPFVVAQHFSFSNNNKKMSLTKHEQWEYYDNTLKQVASGTGIDSLRNALPDSDCGFAIFRLDAENVGNTGPGIVTQANIILQWKGPSSNAISKNKNNGALQTAIDKITPNKGFIEVLGKKNLTTNNIYDRWRPGSGSKVIDD